MFDAQAAIDALQEAVRFRDRGHLEATVSDRNWFEIEVRRELDPGDARVVELWVRQSREPVAGEDGAWQLLARHPQREEIP